MRSGFTLIELLLYISVVAALMLGLASFVPLATDTQVRGRAIREVEDQGQAVITLMSQLIRDGASLDLQDGASGSSLRVTLTQENHLGYGFNYDSNGYPISPPIVVAVSLANGVIEAYNSVDTKSLSSDQVTASGLQFSRRGNAIEVDLTLSHRNPANLSPYSYTQTFHGSASLRP